MVENFNRKLCSGLSLLLLLLATTPACAQLQQVQWRAARKTESSEGAIAGFRLGRPVVINDSGGERRAPGPLRLPTNGHAIEQASGRFSAGRPMVIRGQDPLLSDGPPAVPPPEYNAAPNGLFGGGLMSGDWLPWRGGSFIGNPCNDCDSGVYIAADLYFVQPFWESNPAVFVSATNPAGTVTVNSLHDFNYDYDLATRFSLGYEGQGGWGVRASWFRYNQDAGQDVTNDDSNVTIASANGFLFSTPGAGEIDVFAFSSDLEMNVWDFDLTQRLVKTNCWDLLGGVGVRYAHLSQDYSAYQTRVDGGGGVLFSAAELSSNTFDGLGPDIFLEGRRRIGGSGFAVYGNLRAGVLFGNGRQTLFTLLETPGLDPVYTGTTASRDDVLPFLEVAGGVEWTCCNWKVFRPVVRVGVFSQTWFGAGNGSSTGANNFENLGLFGLNFTFGGRF